MEPAPELVAFAERLFRSISNFDGEAIADAFSREEGTVAIGTALEEWWVDFDEIAALFRVQLQEMAGIGPVHLEVQRLDAFKEGSVGWIQSQMVAPMGDVPSTPLRLTMTLHEEGAYWRVVQYHASFPLSNEESFGMTMTTALDDILIEVQGDAPPSSALSDDGSTTIVFTDIEGSTALMETLGETSWLELLAWHEEVVHRQTVLFGGTVVKGQGDGFMLAFPSIGAGASCAMAIQRSLSAGWNGIQVPVRIGVHSGNARAEGGDFFGRTVVVAARVAGAAAGREILVSRAVQEGLGGALPLAGARTLALKGLSGEQVAFPLEWR
jgi:adenylate cyclase